MKRQLADILTAAAEAGAAELLRRFDAPRQIERKGRIDLVTDADKASEAAVVAVLRAAFPDAAVLAEEGGATTGTSGLRFIVDPLDGTTNYAHHIPHFSVTLAAEVDGQVVAGVVLDPVRGELFAAVRGGGATLNGRPIHISGEGELGASVLATGFPYDVRETAGPICALLERYVSRARGLRRFGSAALDLAWVAAGRFDGYWERGLKPWDTAAGALLVTEAGGRCALYDGRPFDPFEGSCVAAGPGLLPEMLAISGTYGS